MKKAADTAYFEWATSNPKSHIKGCDCVVRSISMAMGKPWEEVYKGLCELGANEYRMPNDPALYAKYLQQQGWVKKPQPRKEDNTKYTGKEFIKAGFGKNHNIICHIGGHHLSCVVGGKFKDIFDPTEGCIGNYWVKY